MSVVLSISGLAQNSGLGCTKLDCRFNAARIGADGSVRCPAERTALSRATDGDEQFDGESLSMPLRPRIEQ